MKNILIGVLVIGILILGYLFIKQKDKVVDIDLGFDFSEETNSSPISTNQNPPITSNPPTTSNPTTPPPTNNSSEVTQNTNNIKYEKLPPDLKIIETSSGNVSARSADRHFIVAVEFPDFIGNNPYCGFGNTYFPQCVFYVTDLVGDPRKAFVWPTNSALTKYPDSFVRDEYNAVNNYYLSGSATFSGDVTVFTTRRDDGCAVYYKEYWNVDYKTGEAFLIKTEKNGIPNNC